MLWRVCQGIRHLHHAAIIYVPRSAPYYTPSPPPWSRLQCTSAATLLHPRADLHQTSSQRNASHPKSVEAKSDEARRSPIPWTNPHRNWPQPEPGLVDMVDDLFALRNTGDITAERLKIAANPELLVHLQDREKVRVLAALMVNTSHPQRAHRVLLLARELGCPVKLNAFEAAAYQLAQTKQWEHMASIVSLAQQLCGRTSTRLLNWHARALLECSQFGLLDHVLSSFEHEKLKPTRRTFLVILSGHLRNRDLTKAKACLDQMDKAGFAMDAETHAVIARAYRSLGADSAVDAGASDALPSLAGSSATPLLNSLLQLALDSNNLLSALRYLKYFDLQCMGDTYDVVGAAITRVGGESGFLLPSAPLIVAPDAATFTIIINHFIKKRQIPLALRMLHNVMLSGVQPDSALAASVTRAYCAAQDLESAVAIGATMCGDLPEALRILASLGLKPDQDPPTQLFRGLPLTIDVINALLRGILVRRRIAGMRPMYRLMRIAGLRPNDETVGVFLSHLYRIERAGPRELLMVLKTLSGTTPPTLDHMHIIVRAIHRSGMETMQARGWWSLWMKLRGRKYRRDGSWSLLDEPEEIDPSPAEGAMESDSGYQRSLKPIIQSLADRHLRADKETIRLRMRRHITVERDVDLARADLQVMLDRGMHVTKDHLATIMRGYTLSGDMREAERVFRTLEASDITPTVDLYTILVAGYARQGRPGQALRAFRRMTTAGIQPDVGAVDALVSAWFAAGAYGQAREVLIRMWPHVAPFPEELRNADTHTLAKRFRSLDSPEQDGEGSRPQGQEWRRWRMKSQQNRRTLMWKLNRLMIDWNRYSRFRREEWTQQRAREAKSSASSTRRRPLIPQQSAGDE